VAATSPQTHREAAQKGIGVLSSSSFMGFEYLRNALNLYDETFDATTHDLPSNRSKSVMIFGSAVCLDTMDEALEEVPPAIAYAKNALGAYERLSKLSTDYAYMGAVKDIDFHDPDFMLNESAGFVVGDPAECIRQIQRFADLGIDTLLMRIDSVRHEVRMRTIENLGRWVLPHFQNPQHIVKSADDALEEIRAARPAHYERVAQLEKQLAAQLSS